MYSPLVEIVPSMELPPATPLTVQMTLVLDEPLTVAANCWVCETCTVALPGDTVTETVGGPAETTVTRALADFDGSVVLTAETVTEDGDGRMAGAV